MATYFFDTHGTSKTVFEMPTLSPLQLINHNLSLSYDNWLNGRNTEIIQFTSMHTEQFSQLIIKQLVAPCAHRHLPKQKHIRSVHLSSKSTLTMLICSRTVQYTLRCNLYQQINSLTPYPSCILSQ